MFSSSKISNTKAKKKCGSATAQKKRGSRLHSTGSYLFAFLGVFAVWCFISHGFWLGWYYGIHMISPADIVFFPYSENITLNAFFISLATVCAAFIFSAIRNHFRDFELIVLFREKTPIEEEVKMVKSQLGDYS